MLRDAEGEEMSTWIGKTPVDSGGEEDTLWDLKARDLLNSETIDAANLHFESEKEKNSKGLYFNRDNIVKYCQKIIKISKFLI